MSSYAIYDRVNMLPQFSYALFARLVASFPQRYGFAGRFSVYVLVRTEHRQSISTTTRL